MTKVKDEYPRPKPSLVRSKPLDNPRFWISFPASAAQVSPGFDSGYGDPHFPDGLRNIEPFPMRKPAADPISTSC